jgi:hypothetical protein
MSQKTGVYKLNEIKRDKTDREFIDISIKSTNPIITFTDLDDNGRNIYFNFEEDCLKSDAGAQGGTVYTIGMREEIDENLLNPIRTDITNLNNNKRDKTDINFIDSINITKSGKPTLTLENNEKGLSVKCDVSQAYLDNSVFLDNIVLNNIVPGSGAGGGNITLCQYPGAGGNEGLIILGPEGLGNQLDVRNIQTRGVNFTDQQPNSFSKRFLYWDGAQDMNRLINNSFKMANLRDTLQIIYSQAYTGTSWASELQTTVSTDMEAQKILVLNPQTNNETFAITSPYNLVSEYGRIRFINISSNHSAKLNIFTDNVHIGAGDILTVVNGYASNTYKTFVGL